MSRNNRNVETCCAKSLTGLKLYVTSADIVANGRHMLGPSMLRPFARALRETKFSEEEIKDHQNIPRYHKIFIGRGE